MIIDVILIWLGIGIIADLLAAVWLAVADNICSRCRENPTETLARVTFIESYKDMPCRMHAILIIAPFFLLKVLQYPLEPKE